MSNCTDPRIGSLLPNYEFHLLTPEETETFEIHLLSCSACADSLRNGQSVLELLKSDSRIKVVIQQLSSGERSLMSRLLESWWPPLPFLLKPAVFGIAALLAISSTIYFSDWQKPTGVPVLVPEQLDSTNLKKQIGNQANSETSASKVQLLEIATLRGTSTQFNVSKNESLVLSFASELSADGHELSLILFGDRNDTLFHARPFVFDTQARGQIFLPAALIRTGTYRIEIQTLSDTTQAENELIDFSVTTE